MVSILDSRGPETCVVDDAADEPYFFTDTSPRRARHVIVPGVPSDDVGDTWIEQWAVVAQRRFRGVAVHDVSDRQIGGGPGAGFSDRVLVVPFRSSAQAMAVIEDVCNEFPEPADGHGERWTAVVPSLDPLRPGARVPGVLHRLRRVHGTALIPANPAAQRLRRRDPAIHGPASTVAS